MLKKEKNHAEIIVIRNSFRPLVYGHEAAAPRCRAGVTDMRNEAAEKIIEILLAAASATLCAMIDHFINQKEK